MARSTRETLYPTTRLSAKISQPGLCGSDTNREPLDYAVIEALRSAREDGHEALVATERFDPDFSIDLSRCRTQAEADALLDRWFDRRRTVLTSTRATLRRIWQEHYGTARSNPTD